MVGPFVFVSVAFGLPGLVMWIIAFLLIQRGRSGGRGGVDIVGDVVGHGGYCSRGQDMFYPKYRAVLADGTTLECAGTTATNWKRPPVGTRVSLMHVPSDAETPLRERGVPLGLLIGAITLFVVGAGMFVLCTVATVSIAKTANAHSAAAPEPAAAPRGAPQPPHRLTKPTR